MSDFDLSAFFAGVGFAAAAVVVVLALTYTSSRVAGRHSVIDVAWGLLFAAMAAVTFIASAGHGGDTARRVALLALTSVWGLRLAVHIGRRARGKPEDPRYDQLLSKAKGNRELYAIRTIYLLQGVLAVVIAGPVLMGMYTVGSFGVLGALGVLVWLVGVLFEGVGDWQMERFRANPANRGRFIEVGLWRYTRHPNYFGDACVWWGLFLVAATHWPGVLTVYAPIVMTLLLTKGSGARILDKHMSQRPGWEEYANRTSGFFPLPPRLTAALRRG